LAVHTVLPPSGPTPLLPPHLLYPPPPQNWGAVQVPQLIVPPQPSPFWPQVAPSSAHVFAVQPPLSFPRVGASPSMDESNVAPESPCPFPKVLALDPPPHDAAATAHPETVTAT
jgi:hypothetical protein